MLVTCETEELPELESKSRCGSSSPDVNSSPDVLLTCEKEELPEFREDVLLTCEKEELPEFRESSVFVAEYSWFCCW